MTASVCPLCMGAGWRISSMSSITDARCHACQGKGIVWPPVDHDLYLVGQVAERDAEIKALRERIEELEALPVDSGLGVDEVLRLDK